jgi:hypothetical protein
MASVFIIGLPRGLRARLEAEALRNDIPIVSTLADADRHHLFRLLPFPGQALADLQHFADEENDWTQLKVVVLPYAPVPPNVMDELGVLIEGGANVLGISATSGPETPWPTPTVLNAEFLDAVFEVLVGLLFRPRVTLPSEHYQRLARRNRRLLLIEGCLDRCDDVAAERYPFMIKVANAFEKIIKKGHIGERIKTFLQDMGLLLAQSGGIETELTLKREMSVLYKGKSHTHVKLGDGQSPQMCARVYFHYCSIDEAGHIAVMYTGPHPEADIERTHYL